MEFIFVRGLWGMEEPSLEAQLKRIKEAGFDAIECAAPATADARKEMAELLAKYELMYVAQQHSGGQTADEHVASYEEQFLRALDLNPLLINSHSGKDYFSLADNCKIIDKAADLAAAHDVLAIHEIHRGRCTFSSTACMELLDARPETKLCADFSHWCCVHESLLADQQERVDRAIAQSYHIHARVGHPEGPQVTHPAAPEWAGAVDAHLAWWDKIVETRRAAGDKQLTICPEFGPRTYMPSIPFTNQPVADLFEVNLYMKERLAKRYQA